MIRFGMPHLLEIESLEDTAKLCRELGLSFIELNMNLPACQPDTLDVERLRRIAGEYGISYTLHLDENLNVHEFNPRLARAWRETMLDTIALAKALDIPVLNMHLNRGVHFTLPEKKVYLVERYWPVFRDGAAAFRDACGEAVGDSGVRICVENLTGYLPWQVTLLDTLLESPAFGLTLDVGHDYCTGGGDLAVITARRERLRHMHLHDAQLPGRDHLALGTGQIDLAARLALAAECDCSVVVETKTEESLRRSVRWLRENM